MVSMSLKDLRTCSSRDGDEHDRSTSSQKAQITLTTVLFTLVFLYRKAEFDEDFVLARHEPRTQKLRPR